MGGSAFNGRALVKVLLEEGHEVTVCNRGRTVVEHPGPVALLAADRTDHDALRGVLAGTEWDAVIDMTAYHPEDVELMIELFEGRVGHYIYVSSTVTYAEVTPDRPGPIDESYPDARGPNQYEYGLHKLLAEDALVAAHRDRGFPGTTVSLSMVFGPHNALPGREQRMFSRLLLGRPVLVPGDGSTLGIVGHVEDQGRAFAALLGVEASFGKRFNLTGDDPHTDNRYVEVLAGVVGVSPEVVHIPAPLMDDLWDNKISLTRDGGARASMDIRPTDAAIDRVLPHLHKGPLANLIQRIQPSIHRWSSDVVFEVAALKEVTGWSPSFNFEQAAEHTFAWWTEAGLHHTVEQDFTYEDEILALVANHEKI